MYYVLKDTSYYCAVLSTPFLSPLFLYLFTRVLYFFLFAYENLYQKIKKMLQ